MKYEKIDINSNSSIKTTQIVHPEFYVDVYENLKSSSFFKDFAINNKNSNSWFIFSDYCLDDKNKPNNVMSFSIIAVKDIKKFKIIGEALKILQKKDCKDSKEINPAFLNFISLLPIFNISYVLPDKRNFTKAFDFNELEFLKIRYESLKHFFLRAQAFPTIGKDFSERIKDIKFIQTKLNSKSVNLRIFRDIEIITSIITSIVCLISEHTKRGNQTFSWFSDRDSLLTYESGNLSAPLVFAIINASLNSLSIYKNKVAFYHPEPSFTFDTDHFNRIPDIVAATLADMSETTVSNKKYIPILNNYLTLEEKNHVAKFYLQQEKYGVSTLKFLKKK